MTRISVLCTTLAALAVAALPLSAGEVTGKIKQLSNEDDVIELEGGPTFFLSEGASLKGLKPGQTVTVTYEEQADLKIAVKIAPAEGR